MDDTDTPPVARVHELLQWADAGNLSAREAAELMREFRRQLTPRALQGGDFDALVVWWLQGRWVHATRRRHVRCEQCRLTGGAPTLHQCARCHQKKAEAQRAHRDALGIAVSRGRRRGEGVHGFDDVDERNELIGALLWRLTKGSLVVVTHELQGVQTRDRERSIKLTADGRYVAYFYRLRWYGEVVVLDASMRAGDPFPRLALNGDWGVFAVLGRAFNVSAGVIHSIYNREKVEARVIALESEFDLSMRMRRR